jgi:hypothetical protein
VIWFAVIPIPILISVYLIKLGEIEIPPGAARGSVVMSKNNSTAYYFWAVIGILWAFASLFFIALIVSILKLVKKEALSEID